MTTSGTASTEPLRGLDLESRQMVLDALKQVRKNLLPKERVLELDRKEEFPDFELREMMGPDYGLQLLFLPEKYGGIDGGARDVCEMVREMSTICLGVSTGFFAMQLGAEPLVTGGTEEQKKKWLGRIAEGRCLVAYAVTEAAAGSNLAALQTKADPITDADGTIVAYKINGTKQFISTGTYADFMTVLAKTPEGPTFFVVEEGTPGFVRSKSEEKHGIRSSNTAALVFEDVEVPVENMVGDTPGEGLIQAGRVFGYTRLMVAAMALGAGESAMRIVIPYAQEREQFGTPLSQKQGYTHKLVVPHMVRLEAAAAYIEEVATRIDSNEGVMQVEGSIAKYFSSETANRAAEDSIQALGGYGYIAEYEVEKIKRDVKITCIYEGTSEIQQSIISTFRWKATRKSKGEYYESMAVEMDALQEELPGIGADQYARAARALNYSVQFAQKNSLTRKQFLMFALADMMTHVEVGISLARRAKRRVEGGAPDADRVSLYCRLFAAEVSQLVAQNMLTVFVGTDVVPEDQLAATLGDNGYGELMTSARNTVNDMDRAVAFIFE